MLEKSHIAITKGLVQFGRGSCFSYDCVRGAGGTKTNWPEATAIMGLEGISPSLPSH